MLNTEINKLKSKIISFSYHVENMISNSSNAFKNKDIDVLNYIIKKDEKKANSLEVKIEKNCISTIAQFAPKASNLRIILMILKMNNDLERMADNCVSISYSFIELIEKTYSDDQIEDIIEITQIVVSMLNDSIKSFIDEDIELAKNVCKRDKIVDKFRNKKRKKIRKSIQSDSDDYDELLQYLKIYDKFERIADLATNIAEDVVFIAKGKVIRHKK